MTNQAQLPESIRRQIEEAEALEKQLYGQAPEEGNTEPVDDAPQDEDVQAVSEEPEAQPVEPQPQDDEEDKFRRRYEVLKGKYDAEVPRLSHQVRELNENLQRAMQEIEMLRQAPQAPQKVEEKPDNDAEVFGEDLVEAVDRRAEKKARALVAEQTAELKQYIEQLEARLGNVNQQVAVSAQDRFYSRLGQLVPDYEAVNGDEGFLNWLGQVDPVYGVPRQAALDAAAQAMDADRVANVFMAYKSLTGKQTQAAQKQQVRQELERQVAPSRTQASAATPQQGKIWTKAEFERAYDPRTIRELGQERADALVAEAEVALAEGRVQW